MKLTYLGGMGNDKEYSRAYLHERTGLHMEVHTKRDRNGFAKGSTAKRYWYHPQDKKTHTSYKDALQSAIELGLISNS